MDESAHSTQSNPNPHMHWGLRAPDGYVGPAWGARAIYKLGGRFQSVKQGRKMVSKYVSDANVDIPWDRQSLVGGTDAERHALAEWVNSEGMAALKAELVRRNVNGASSETVTVCGGGFVLSASPRESCGYLYIGCWEKV